ncbi:cytochrome C oxidase subunit IV family protein [Caldalkalibacillus salinus]|uniref:cytochrome C oxidase subunit IV family protein n=1 Tax=Caldalkalibacillus salinus TaxID=2803787 RepID=UPI00192489E8|nr:cytochrome C oxidase subunit IV family protein [Caldalkalibacillus salinus]
MDPKQKRAQKKHKRERIALIWAFILSLLLTVISFIAVGTNIVEEQITLFLFIVMLAMLQAIIQLFYFMHLKDKGHRMPNLFIFSSIFVAIVAIYGINEWLWW